MPTLSPSQAGPTTLTVNESPAANQNLKATPLAKDGGVLTRLSFSVSTTPGVTGYRIYRKEPTSPGFALLASTTTSGLDTGLAWAGGDTPAKRLFSVTAVDGAGRESFLSNVVTNDDADGDGLTDADEVAGASDPALADTDRDGLEDGVEAANGTHALAGDTDGDGA